MFKWLARGSSKRNSVRTVHLLFAICRRMDKRLAEAENTIRLLKRDVARVDRMNYRAAEKEEAETGQEAPKTPKEIADALSIRYGG